MSESTEKKVKEKVQRVFELSEEGQERLFELGLDEKRSVRGYLISQTGVADSKKITIPDETAKKILKASQSIPKELSDLKDGISVIKEGYTPEMRKILVSLRREKARLMDKHYINRYTIGNNILYFVLQEFVEKFEEDVETWNKRQTTKVDRFYSIVKESEIEEKWLEYQLLNIVPHWQYLNLPTRDRLEFTYKKILMEFNVSDPEIAKRTIAERKQTAKEVITKEYKDEIKQIEDETLAFEKEMAIQAREGIAQILLSIANSLSSYSGIRRGFDAKARKIPEKQVQKLQEEIDLLRAYQRSNVADEMQTLLDFLVTHKEEDNADEYLKICQRIAKLVGDEEGKEYSASEAATIILSRYGTVEEFSDTHHMLTLKDKLKKAIDLAEKKADKKGWTVETKETYITTLSADIEANHEKTKSELAEEIEQDAAIIQISEELDKKTKVKKNTSVRVFDPMSILDIEDEEEKEKAAKELDIREDLGLD